MTTGPMTDPQAALRARAEQRLAQFRANWSPEFLEACDEDYALIRDLAAALVGERPPAQDEAKQYQCHHCGKDFEGEPFIGTEGPTVQRLTKYFFYCSGECRAQSALAASSLPRPEARRIAERAVSGQWAEGQIEHEIEQFAEAEVRALEARLRAVEPYAQHKTSCELYDPTRVHYIATDGFTESRSREVADGPAHCTCGLDAILRPSATRTQP